MHRHLHFVYFLSFFSVVIHPRILTMKSTVQRTRITTFTSTTFLTCFNNFAANQPTGVCARRARKKLIFDPTSLELIQRWVLVTCLFADSQFFASLIRRSVVRAQPLVLVCQVLSGSEQNCFLVVRLRVNVVIRVVRPQGVK